MCTKEIPTIFLLLAFSIASKAQFYKLNSDLLHLTFFYDNLQIDDLQHDSVKSIAIIKCRINNDSVIDSVLVKKYRFYKSAQLDSFESFQYTKFHNTMYTGNYRKVIFKPNHYSDLSNTEFSYPFSQPGGFGEMKTINYTFDNDTITTLTFKYSIKGFDDTFMYIYNTNKRLLYCKEFYADKLIAIFIYKYEY